MAALGPFDDPQLAVRYETWYAGAGRRADALEKRLLGQLIRHLPLARTALEIGCGTGHFTRWMTEQGWHTTGLDISSSMLTEAQRLGGAMFVQGDATSLPFRDATFDVVALITTLEFVHEPERAITEAVRVARHGLRWGVLNRHSLLAARRRASGKPVWQAARFFTVGELIRLVRCAAGARSSGLRWRTTLWPVPMPESLPLPWGGLIGMAIRLSR